MADINRYLESQKALAIQKSNLMKKSTLVVSELSKKSANAVSRKQQKELDQSKQLDDTIINSSDIDNCEPGPSRDAVDECSSEYVPSSDEEEQSLIGNPSSVPRYLTKNNIKKIIDDGDKRMYQKRTDKWKNNLKVLKSEGRVLNEEDITTSDVRYWMDGNDDGFEEHEVTGGLCVPKYIWKQLYKYQRSGVKWLWELHQIKSGGLLGDEMGLGKTVQLIAFMTGLSKTQMGTWGGLGPSIIVTPATVIYQWVSHFHYWFPGLRVAVLHNSGSHNGRHHSLIREIHESHGVLLVTYAGIVRYNTDLITRNWHYIVLDEGHKIRNPDTQVSKMVKKFQTPHRILITGSPMQNSLQELWSLFDFMSPGLLGTQTAFIEFFAIPITQGGYSNATQLQEVTAYEIAKSLKNIITPYMIRRTKAEVQDHIHLPEKNEQVLFCSLSQEQRDLYLGYLLGNTVRSILDKDQRFGDPLRARILVAISTLRKICNHPDLYLCEAYDDEEPLLQKDFGNWKKSGKMVVVQSLLKIWQKQGHRALIFSQSRSMLCILEQHLIANDYKYLKMDGTVSVGYRQNIIKAFNDNLDYLVFLATTRVGGLGVNLTGADRVIIYDPDWNPATDSQAKERAWRIGQRKNVTIYRLLSAGTIEEKIYQRQIFKHLLGNKVLIDPNQKNPLKTSNLQGLFTLEEPNRDGDTETASIFSHTKVGTSQKEDTIARTMNSGGRVSFSMKKMAAMRKRAREISKKIAREHAPKPVDHRERYKFKREQILNPSRDEQPGSNLFDDKETDIPFDRALSELDIVNLHTKKDYLEKLLKENLEEQSKLNKNESNEELDIGSVSYDIGKTLSCTSVSTESEPVVVPYPDKKIKVGSCQCKLKKKKHKRCKIDKGDEEVGGLVAVKKVKKKDEHSSGQSNDDDYVLSKLFAKSGVQSALEHDKIVGLAKKEERHKLKEEATKKAKAALRAIKKSVKKSNLMD